MSILFSAVNEIYRKNDDFLFVGLTGRTGSGCSTVASILASGFDVFKESSYIEMQGNDFRKQKILFNSLKNRWINFQLIQVRSIITLMLSQESGRKLKPYLLDVLGSDEDKVFGLISILVKIRKINGYAKHNNENIDAVKFYTVDLPRHCEDIRVLLGSANFVKLYQSIGKNLRKSGSTVNEAFIPDKFFTLARKIEEICLNILRINKSKNLRTAIVIDAIRSPLEGMYFQDRYAAFYLMAVSCSEKERRNRLGELSYQENDIDLIDEQEGTGKDLDELDYYSAQNIPACLQRSDIYIHNPAFDSKIDPLAHLKRQLIKFIALMHSPGVTTPSSVERCMQIAYTAKLNSGCISRQVGAVVTDEYYSVKSIGWNDVPSGHVPCNLRSRVDLVDGVDREAYSDYELTNDNFKSHISKNNKIFTPIIELGRNPSYCFKSEYKSITGKDNQVHTRALHAEENAFLQVSKHGGIAVSGGYLFSTASPCELCAKKSVQLGIERIYYIDPYPGISELHIIGGGRFRPEMVLFEGAIGRAFHNLYNPTLPYKDELSALSLSD